MERSIDFSDVTNYVLDAKGPDLILKLFQDGIVTKINISTQKIVSETATPPLKSKVLRHSLPIVKVIRQKEQADSSVAVISAPEPTEAAESPQKGRVHSGTRLVASQVKEIRQNWQETVRACGSKNAAAAQLAKIYNCSAKNIYAIIYRYSWCNL